MTATSDRACTTSATGTITIGREAVLDNGPADGGVVVVAHAAASEDLVDVRERLELPHRVAADADLRFNISRDDLARTGDTDALATVDTFIGKSKAILTDLETQTLAVYADPNRSDEGKRNVEAELRGKPPPGLRARLVTLFAGMKWTFAKSYAGGDAEHFYTKRHGCTAEQEQQFLFATRAIQVHGHREQFHGSWWTALDAGDGFHYWAGRRDPPPPSALINRRPLQRPPVPLYAKQELHVEDASLLLPEVPHIPGTDVRQIIAWLVFGRPVP